MKVITKTLSFNDLKKMAADMFGDIVKAVVDIDRELIAVDAELQSDLEALLLEDGSQQKHLWESTSIRRRPAMNLSSLIR
jgi:hypothetical protein